MSYGNYQGYQRPATLAGSTTNPFASTSYTSAAPNTSPFNSYRPGAYPPPANTYSAASPFATSPFPPAPSGFPPASSAYPPAAPAYPASTSPFPSSTPAYPSSTSVYNPQSSGYPPTHSGFQPASSAFNTSYTSASYNSVGTVGVRYTPGEERENMQTTVLLHITNMTAFANKSTEELRYEDYGHNRARSKLAPQQPYPPTGYSTASYGAPAFPASTTYPPPSSTAPFAAPATYGSASNPFTQPASTPFAQPAPANPFGTAQPAANPFGSANTANPFAPQSSSAYNRPPAQSNSVFAPTPTASSFFANPAAQASVFGPNSLTPSRSTFPSTTQGFAPSQAANPFASAASAFSQPAPSLPSYSSFQSRPQGSMQGYGFTPQPAMPAAAPMDNQAMIQAYRDPIGLSWLFPQGVPEEYRKPLGPSVLAHTTTVEQILRNKSPVSSSVRSINLTERWRRNRERRAFSPIKAKTSVSPVRNEASVFSKKEFAPLQLEPRSEIHLSPPRQIQVTVKTYTPEPVTHSLSLERGAKAAALIEQVAAFVHPKPTERVELVCRGRKLRADEVVNNNDEVTVILESNQQPLDPRLLPRLTRPGYSTEPSLAVLSNMTLAELQRVRDFLIRNEHGEILFEGETNVVELDLDAIVQIEAKAVVVYPEGTSKPPVGRGLNKPAIVRLLNCQPKREQVPGEFEAKVRKICQRNGSEFVSYSADTGDWVFRVAHF